MDFKNVIKQAARRAGEGYTRKRDTVEFKESAKNWRAIEKPERVVNRMEQLGMHREAASIARGIVMGAAVDAFNPLERIIGQSQLMSSFFLPLGAERSRAVGRIVTDGGIGFGTGFLISPRLLMTNNHVLEDAATAARCRVQFDYVMRPDGTISSTQLFRLLPGEFFITSVGEADFNLDYTIVAVEPVNTQGTELATRGCIPLIITSGKLVMHDLTNIIQHPGGEPQQIALRDSKVVKSLEHFYWYEADTQPGSSGSPVFNDQWQLAALHHSGVPEEIRPGVYRLIDDGEWDTSISLPRVQQLQMAARVKWIANEGVRVSSIVGDVQARLRGDAKRLALFEDTVREHVAPPASTEVRRTPSQPATEIAAPTPDVAPSFTQRAATWTIPLQVTIQLGPEMKLSLTGDAPTPATTTAPALLPATPDQIVTPPPLLPPDHEAVVARARELLESRPGILEVRDGFLWRDGQITERRAVVVVLNPNVPAGAGDAHESLDIPREINDVPVDVTVGGPMALLRASERRGQFVSESLPLADLFQERVPRITYEKPEGLSLDEVEEPMEVICHVSPDDAWPVLREFLGRAKRTLTLGIFDLTAPHIVESLQSLAAKPGFRFNLAIQRGMAGGLAGEKKNDIDEGEVVEGLREIMGDRLRQAFVDVSGNDRTFASSYHIKVAVRDGREVWLSSGNMQSSNQPPPDVQPAADDEQTLGPLKRFNREWHVVINNRALAQTFESYLLYDLETAEQNPAELPAPRPERELFVPAAMLDEEEENFLEEAAKPRYFARKVFRKDTASPVRVQPLLTPDNYIDHAIAIVRTAERKLFIQNQSLTLLDPLSQNEDKYIKLWTAIKQRQDAGVDLRMIFRVHIDEDEARRIKDLLVKFGFKPGLIRVQKGCHTKGIIVDSKVVLVGSHNWTNQGAIVNRDASLIFRHPEIARYYEEVFLFDWERLAREPKPAKPQTGGRGGNPQESLRLSAPGSEPPRGLVRITLRDLLDD